MAKTMNTPTMRVAEESSAAKAPAAIICSERPRASMMQLVSSNEQRTSVKKLVK